MGYNCYYTEICKIVGIILPLSLVLLLYLYTLPDKSIINLIRGNNTFFLFEYTVIITMLEMMVFLAYYHYQEV